MLTRRNTIAGAITTGAIFLADQSAARAAVCRSAGLHQPIHEQSFVPVGGIDQWIEIMGADQQNPVLLVLHGGPGSTWDPFSDLLSDWESHFTMVYWSQRGAGKTYRKSGPAISDTMTIDRMVDDGIEVAQYLKTRLGKDKIVLLGHSWGTILGVKMVQKQPELFSAYVGTGQVVNMIAGERAGLGETLRRAKKANRPDAVAALENLGVPPYNDIQKMVIERKWAGVFEPASDAAFDTNWKNPDWFTPEDNKERFQAWLFSNYLMYGSKQQDGPAMAVDFTSSAKAFAVPMIFIQGAVDNITPPDLVAAYERQITAPYKSLVLLPGGGHNAIFGMKDAFLQETLKQIAALPTPVPISARR